MHPQSVILRKMKNVHLQSKRRKSKTMKNSWGRFWQKFNILNCLASTRRQARNRPLYCYHAHFCARLVRPCFVVIFFVQPTLLQHFKRLKNNGFLSNIEIILCYCLQFFNITPSWQLFHTRKSYKHITSFVFHIDLITAN